jgi:hypothetical protein
MSIKGYIGLIKSKSHTFEGTREGSMKEVVFEMSLEGRSKFITLTWKGK